MRLWGRSAAGAAARSWSAHRHRQTIQQAHGNELVPRIETRIIDQPESHAHTIRASRRFRIVQPLFAVSARFT